MSNNFSTTSKVTRVQVGVAAGQAANASDSVDMLGYEAVTFLTLVGAITAGGTVTIKAQQSSDDGVADAFSDIEGSEIAYADDDDDKLAILEIDRPQKRYVKVVVTTATENGVIDGVVAIQTRAFALAEPVTHDATTVAAALFLHAPAEGTP